MRSVLAVMAVVGCVGAAHAAPPAPGSEDADLLMPYADWIKQQTTNQGGLCCSLSDCRVVKWRPAKDGYQAFISQNDDRGFTKFPGAPNGWVNVPEDAIKRGVENPSGQAIACWSRSKADNNGFYCFLLPELG